MSIRAKLIAAVAASMAGLAVATGAVVRETGERNVRIAAEQAIAGAGQALLAQERADVEKLDATLRALAGHGRIADAFAARDRRRLQEAAAPVFAELRENHDITHFYFVEPEPSRRVFLRVHRPAEHGDVVDRATLSRAIDTLALGAGKELGRSAIALRVVRPWYGRDGSLTGYVELGEEIDHFLARMKVQTGDEYAMLIDKVFLDRASWARSRAGRRDNWDDHARAVVVDATLDEELVSEFEGDVSSVPDRGLFLEHEERDGRLWAHGIVPVKDAAGRRVGGLFVQHDITDLHASMIEARRGLYAALAVAAAVLGALLVAFVNRLLLRRLDRVRHDLDVVAGRLAVGDLAVRPPRSRGQDELGDFEDAVGKFVDAVVEVVRQETRRRRG